MQCMVLLTQSDHFVPRQLLVEEVSDPYLCANRTFRHLKCFTSSDPRDSLAWSLVQSVVPIASER